MMKNSLSRKEGDAIIDQAIQQGGPFMSLADTLAHAAKLSQEKQMQTA